MRAAEGEFAPKPPVNPGHELAGEAVAVGSAVTELSVGARVALDPSLSSFECHCCRIGHNDLCERWAAIGVTRPGAAAEFVAAPVANRAVLPESVRTEDAALIEPLSCSVRGYDTRDPTRLPRARPRRRDHGPDDAPARRGHRCRERRRRRLRPDSSPACWSAAPGSSAR